MLLDIHSEYGRALRSESAVFRVNPSADEQPLRIPFWALDPTDLLAFLMGKLDNKPLSQILDRIFEKSRRGLTSQEHSRRWMKPVMRRH